MTRLHEHTACAAPKTVLVAVEAPQMYGELLREHKAEGMGGEGGGEACLRSGAGPTASTPGAAGSRAPSSPAAAAAAGCAAPTPTGAPPRPGRSL